MFAENLKMIRKAKGVTQEELAIHLGVVRQTISKWEKGLSVPDAEMLIKIGEFFEVPVSRLLGATIENDASPNEIAEQLSKINEQLAVKNRRGRFVLRIILGIVIGIVVVNLLLIAVSVISFNSIKDSKNVTITEETEIAVPTE